MSSATTESSSAPSAAALVGSMESPFIADPSQAAAMDIPTEYVRRVEEAQRIYGDHHLQHRVYSQAWNHAAVTVGVQCGWMGVGAWVISRGLRYSDPINSLVARWVQNPTTRRLTTPISTLGWVILTVTATQIPLDVGMLMDASKGIDEQVVLMRNALESREDAFRQGRKAAAVNAEKEKANFESQMKIQ